MGKFTQNSRKCPRQDNKQWQIVLDGDGGKEMGGKKKDTDVISISVPVLAVCSLFCQGVSHASPQNVFCFPCGCSQLRKQGFATKAEHHFCATAGKGWYHSPLWKVSWKCAWFVHWDVQECSHPDPQTGMHTHTPTHLKTYFYLYSHSLNTSLTKQIS